MVPLWLCLGIGVSDKALIRTVVSLFFFIDKLSCTLNRKKDCLENRTWCWYTSTPPIATVVIKFGNSWPLIIQNRRDDNNLQVLGLKYTFSVQICYEKMVYYRIDDYNV